MSYSTIVVLALFYMCAKYYLLFGIPFFILVGCIARSKGRSFIGWFLLSVFFSPVLTLLALVAVPRKLSARERRAMAYDGGAIRLTREYY
jgi:hypothetical protein